MKRELTPEAYAVIEGRHSDPFHYLGPHFVDDEPVAVEDLAYLLEKEALPVRVLATANTGAEGLAEREGAPPGPAVPVGRPLPSGHGTRAPSRTADRLLARQVRSALRVVSTRPANSGGAVDCQVVGLRILGPQDGKRGLTERVARRAPNRLASPPVCLSRYAGIPTILRPRRQPPTMP